MTAFFHHPDYDLMAPEWEESRDLYEGKHSVVCYDPRYLYEHQLELQGDDNAKKLRKTRCQRTRYLALQRCVVSLWKTIFFKHSPDYDEKVTALLEPDNGLNDIDGAGTALTTFIKNQVLESLLLYGKPMILADTFDYVAPSKGAEQAAGLRPFLEILKPLDVVDWEINQAGANKGQFIRLRREYQMLMPRASLAEKPIMALHTDIFDCSSGQTIITRYQAQYNSEGQIVLDSNGMVDFAQIGIIPTKLDKIPVAYINGESWVKDVNQETLRFHNLRSSQDNIEHNQAYQRVILAGDSLGDAAQLKALTENAIGIAPAGTTMLIAPPVDTSALRASKEEALSNVFKVGLHQLRLLPGDSRAVQGSDTLAEEKENTIALVMSTIEDVETLVNESLANYALKKGIQNFDGQVNLNREITEEDIDKFISLYQAFETNLKKVEGLTKAVTKKVISKMNLAEEDELLDEAEKTDFTPEEMPINPMLGTPLFGKDKQNGQEEGKDQEEQTQKQGEEEIVKAA